MSGQSQTTPVDSSGQPLPRWATNGVQWAPSASHVPLDGALLSGVTDGLHDLAGAVRTFPTATVREWGVAREAYHQGLFHAAPAGLIVGLVLAAVMFRFSRRPS